MLLFWIINSSIVLEPQMNSSDVFSFSNYDQGRGGTYNDQQHYLVPANQTFQQAPVYQPYINNITPPHILHSQPSDEIAQILSQYRIPKVFLTFENHLIKI